MATTTTTATTLTELYTTTTYSKEDPTDLSIDIAKIRPVTLSEQCLQSLAPRWRDCPCCQEALNRQAVQMQCCDTIFHQSCIREFAWYKAQTLTVTGELAVEFACPWCRSVLNVGPLEIAIFLEEIQTDIALKFGEHLDKYLAQLSLLSLGARAGVLRLASDYLAMKGRLTRAIRLPSKVAGVRSLLQDSPKALEAFDWLCKERESSFAALVEWKDWLVYEEDLTDVEDLIEVATIYGYGRDRFLPRITMRLKGEE